MLATTDNLARSYNVTPFEIMAQDCDEVILLINYLLRKAENAPVSSATPANSDKQYIKVNDGTATGGWW
jgi:hypothetical protein